MPMPELSVVLPCYNEVSNIGKLISSIRNSGLGPEDCEIVVIDDCSSDGTTELLSRLAEVDNGLKLNVTKNRIGLAQSIFLGICESSGTNVAVMDSDGMHDPGYLPKMLLIASNNGCLVIGSRFAPGGSSHGNLYPHVSRLVNFVIQRILKSKVKDQLCGFFVCNRSLVLKIDKDNFTGFGEYFISIIRHFERNEIPILEIGTVHKVRDGGIRKSRRVAMLFNYLRYALRIRK